jgi:hypothetical protein
MNHNFKFLIPFFMFLFVAGKIMAAEQDILVIENNAISKVFKFSKEKPGAINVSLFMNPQKELLTSEKPQPYFEFVINNQVVTANDPVWIFKEHTTRKMGNGGTEHQLTFAGVISPVKDLQIVLFQQIFPKSALMREKLEIKTENQTFKLNKKEGKLHFKFPGYTVQNKTGLPVDLTEIRMATWEKESITFGEKNKGNHMYYPDIRNYEVNGRLSPVKGPVAIVSNENISWFTAYEHASQDNLNGLFDEQKKGSGNLVNDAMQGTKGVFNFPVSEDDFKFLGIGANAVENEIHVAVDMLRGGYLDGEEISKENPYSTVWTATGFYFGKNPEEGKWMLRHYLFNQICEKPASRVPEFYYNTWGMQRQDRNKPLRGILTYERIFEEIEYAAELGVDIFVLDDGWENAQGEWFAHKERLPEGLAPIKKRLDKHGMKMGLWFSPMGIDSTTQRYKAHPEWVIKDSNGNPIQAQWGHPAFDFVSGFFDLFVEDCKKLIDQGCRFMKWDAINTFYSSLPNLKHGSDKYSEAERRARYEYLLPIYVVRAMEILTDYEPELIIEMDLTEARRVMVGLAPLSQGKLFWMNNGASWYNDYTTFRTKSMRTIANEFAGIVPLELFTYANYPQNESDAMKYNVHNSLLAGHGFWGNLQLMTPEEREWVKSQVILSKKVLPYITNTKPEVIGKVGDSPEIYTIVNYPDATGQVIAFSENPVQYNHVVNVNTSNLLGVLNHPYSAENFSLSLPFKFQETQSSAAAFVLANPYTYLGIKSIIASTVAVDDIQTQKNSLTYFVSQPGEQQILWGKQMGKPEIRSSGEFTFEMGETDTEYNIRIRTFSKNSEIVLER